MCIVNLLYIASELESVQNMNFHLSKLVKYDFDQKIDFDLLYMRYVEPFFHEIQINQNHQ